MAEDRRQIDELLDSLRQIAAEPPGEQSLWDSTVAAWAADTIEALQQRVGEFEHDNEALTKHLDDCVQEKLEEINAEAEAYDRDATNTLTRLCETLSEFDWNDYPEGLTTQDAYDCIMEDRDALEGHVKKLQQALQQRVGELETRLYGEQQHSRGVLLDATYKNERLAKITEALKDLVEDLEDRSKFRLDSPGVVACGDGVYQRAKEALRQEPGEGGGGEKLVTSWSRKMAASGGFDDEGEVGAGLLARDPEPHTAQPEQAQEGECPHGCYRGKIITDDGYKLCPIHRFAGHGFIHGTGRQNEGG